MRAVLVAINNTPDGALLLPSGNYDVWDVVPAMPPPIPPRRAGRPAAGAKSARVTVFFTNLGMVGMNVGLDVRVIDQIGLANPLAAHTARIEDGRIGHDKNLFPDWAVAEGPWLKKDPVPSVVPRRGLDQRGRGRTEVPCDRVGARGGPRPADRASVHVERALRIQLHKYRIDRVPQYELIRCGLDEPEMDRPPYTGLPATGP